MLCGVHKPRQIIFIYIARILAIMMSKLAFISINEHEICKRKVFKYLNLIRDTISKLVNLINISDKIQMFNGNSRRWR